MAHINRVVQLLTDEKCKFTHIRLADCPSSIKVSPALSTHELPSPSVFTPDSTKVHIVKCPFPEAPPTDPGDQPSPLYNKLVFHQGAGVREVDMALSQTTASPSYQYFGAANELVFPYIRCMTIDRSTDPITVYTLKNQNTGILKDEIWKHIRGISSSFLRAMDEAVSSSGPAGLAWDDEIGKGFIGHGRLGGFDALLSQFGGDASYVDRYTDLHDEIFDNWSNGAVYIKDGIHYIAGGASSTFHSFDRTFTPDAQLLKLQPYFMTYNNSVVITKFAWCQPHNSWYYKVADQIFKADPDFSNPRSVKVVSGLIDFVLYERDLEIYCAVGDGIVRFSIDVPDTSLPLGGPNERVFTGGVCNCLELFYVDPS